MKKLAIAVHGGASEATPFVRDHLKEIEKGLEEALESGYEILRSGGTALVAVEKAVSILENDLHFNAGRGSALNCQGEVEMDAAIMDGKDLAAGAVSIVRNVKNPIVLAKIVMQKTKHVFLAGYGALELAKSNEIALEPDAYFITEHQYQDYLAHSEQENIQKMMEKKIHGTVGAVALDLDGNIASATSTGGTSNCLPGRIGDSCVIGGGCYANNQTCAVSGTGQGEVLIRRVLAHTISMLIESNNLSLQEACDIAIFTRHKEISGDLGVISVNTAGETGIAFNTEILKRAWMDFTGKKHIKIFK